MKEIDYGEVTNIYTVKPSCPINHGTYMCSQCQYDWSLRAETGGPIYETFYCYNKEEGNICGITHNGLSWCTDCKDKDNDEKRVSHLGEFQVVGQIRGDL